MALEIAAIAADRLARPCVEIADIQLALMRADIWPRDHCEQLATLTLVVLAGATRDTAAATGAAIATLRDRDGTPVVEFVAGLFRPLATFGAGIGVRPTAAMLATVYVELGDRLAVRVHFGCDDGIEVFAFSADPTGYYRPDRDLSVSMVVSRDVV